MSISVDDEASAFNPVGVSGGFLCVVALTVSERSDSPPLLKADTL